MLSQTGQYTLVLDPAGASTGQVTLTAYDFVDVTGPITFGSPITATLTTPGQQALYTFSGSVGQKVSLLISSSSVTSCNSGALSLVGPTTTVSGPNLCAGSFLDTLTLSAAGTYTVKIDPASANTGQVTFTVYNVVDATGTITPGATTGPTTISTPGQNALLTFSATANQRASILITNSTFSQGAVRVFKPDGAEAEGSGLFTNAFGNAFTLPVTGTYTLKIDPYGADTGQVTLVLYVFNDVTGSITLGGGTVSVTLNVPGQRALLTFTGSAGQQHSRHGRNSTISGLVLSTTNAANTWQSSVTGGLGTFDDSSPVALSGAGPYTLIVDPNTTLTGSIDVSITSP